MIIARVYMGYLKITIRKSGESQRTKSKRKNTYIFILSFSIMIVILKPKLTDISGVLQPMSGIYFYATL
jgi:hypothetical protein